MSEDKLIEQASLKESQESFAELQELRRKLQAALDENETLKITIRELETVVKELKNRNSGTTYSYE